MKIRFKGDGTVNIPGAGDVSAGGEIEVPDDTARALLAEQPDAFEAIQATPARKRVSAKED